MHLAALSNTSPCGVARRISLFEIENDFQHLERRVVKELASGATPSGCSCKIILEDKQKLGSERGIGDMAWPSIMLRRYETVIREDPRRGWCSISPQPASRASYIHSFEAI